MLQDITDSRIAAMVAKRRGEFDQRRTKNGEKRLVGPATVNRTVTEPLRQVILRARDVWEVPTANIKWRKHFLKEPQERVREASVAEEAAIISKRSRGYDTAIRFAFLTGCRKKEILGLEWTDVSFTGRCFTVVGKGSRKRTIPMSKAIYALLWAEQGNHPKKVFTFVSSMTRRGRGMVYEKGKRYPLSSEGLPARWSGQSPTLV
jgi:integrase